MSAREPRLFTEENPDNPEDMDIWLDGEVIMTVTYDNAGSAGQGEVRRLVEKLQLELGDRPA